MELTVDLLKSLNNIRQNATIYVHAYHYTDDEKCVMVPRISLPSLKLTPLQSEIIIRQLLNGVNYIRHGGDVQDMKKKCGNFHNTGGGTPSFQSRLITKWGK